ncbi:MAG: RNA methyltransferase [Betaproteobacteria bacterium]|nr:RNA methyltransferase [Betaproteobacteria bacterium]
MNDLSALDRVRVVLSRTSHPGNIGAVARAMKTMGLSRLWLVSPVSFPDPVADARASGASDVLAGAHVVDSLQEALSGTVFAAALTARRRDLSPVRLDPRAAAAELVQWSRDTSGEVALVFGNEASGLSNEELELCALPVTIPANPAYPSLNLGAAVQLMCYELRLAAMGQGSGTSLLSAEPLPEPATHDEIEHFFEHLKSSIVASGFLDPAKPRRLMPRLRRLFGRVRLEKEEIAILRGILSSFDTGVKNSQQKQ